MAQSFLEPVAVWHEPVLDTRLGADQHQRGGQSIGPAALLSQRIAKLYLALSWKLPQQELQTQFGQTVSEFGQALDELQAAPENNAAIDAALAKASAQWAFSQSGFRLSEDGRYVPTLISITCQTLLEQMEGLTRAYTELLL